MFKKSIFFLFMILFSSNITEAQWGILRRIGGGGGFQFGILSPSLVNLNSELKKVDLPEFNNLFFGIGGGGDFTIGGIRFGGFGFGGSSEKEKIRSFAGIKYISKVKLDYGGGFGTIGYEIYHSKKFSTVFDVGIGGGSLDLFISDRTSNSNTWYESLNIPSGITNVTRKLSYSFFSIKPSLIFEYIYGNFIKLFIAGDYNLILSDQWTKDDHLELTNLPKMNFNGFSVRCGVNLGLYF